MARLLPFPPPSDDELVETVEFIKKIEPMMAQGLLRVTELSAIEDRVRKTFESAAGIDSVQFRKYDKARRENTRWRPARRSGYIEPQDANELLLLKQEIVELLSLNDIDVPSTEVFLPANSEFTARRELKNIFGSATESIDIKDDYLFSADSKTHNIEILTVLQPFIGTSIKLSLRLLGGHQNSHDQTYSQTYQHS